MMVRYRDRHLDGALVERDWHEVNLGPLAVGALATWDNPARPARGAGALDVVTWHPWDGQPAELRQVVVLGDLAKWI